MKRTMVLGGGMLVGAWLGAQAQSVTPMSKLDLNQLTGAWFEIAHLPDKTEKHCVGDGRVLYALGDKPGRFQMVTSCRMKDGYIDVRNSNGRRADQSGDGRLKVTTLWPFSRKYWVLGLGPESAWALMGSPNHRSLWIIAKAEMTQADLEAVKAQAVAEGFDTGKLVMAPGWHGAPPSPAIPVKSSKQ